MIGVVVGLSVAVLGFVIARKGDDWAEARKKRRQRGETEVLSAEVDQGAKLKRAFLAEKKVQTELKVQQQERLSADAARARPEWLNKEIPCPRPNCTDPQRTRMRGEYYYIPEQAFDDDLNTSLLPTDDPGGKIYVCDACYRRVVGFSAEIDHRAITVRDFASRKTSVA